MSVFASFVTEKIDIPHDPGNSVTICKLSPNGLKKASQASQKESIENMQDLGGPELLKQIMDLSESGEAADAAAKDPLMLYDPISIMRKGIKSWTYDRDHMSDEVLEDLDDETATFLVTAILRLSKPSLFQTKEESEGDQKNVSSSSPAA